MSTEIYAVDKVKLTEAEMREFAEVFAYYDYGNEDFLLLYGRK